MTLNVYVAHSGIASRRAAALLIKEGKVLVNGEVVLEPWRQVTDRDIVSVDGAQVKKERFVYIVLNKPPGVTSTVDDPFATRKVIDYAPPGAGRVYPVGRLDRLSRGLLILTNDGDFCYKLTHPKFNIEKEYSVTVKGEVDDTIIERLKRGVQDEGEHLRARSAAIRQAGVERSVIDIIVNEGKKRHLRRMLSSLGFHVLDLRRVRIGGLQLGALKEGTSKMMERDEIYKKVLQLPARSCHNTPQQRRGGHGSKQKSADDR